MSRAPTIRRALLELIHAVEMTFIMSAITKDFPMVTQDLLRAMTEAYRAAGYTEAEIGRHLDMIKILDPGSETRHQFRPGG